MIECSENQMNINIAKDILKQIDRLAYNTEAPFFSLKDKDGNLIKLCDYQDNMVLLQFVDKVNPMLNYQFDELDRLQKQWQDTIQIVTIATKDGFDDLEQVRLRDFCTRVAQKRAMFVASNSDPVEDKTGESFFEQIYSQFVIKRVIASRQINANPNSRGVVSEIMISNVVNI